MSENTPSTPASRQEPPRKPSLPHAHPDSHHSSVEQDRAAMLPPPPPPPLTTTPATGAAFGRGLPPSHTIRPRKWGFRPFRPSYYQPQYGPPLANSYLTYQPYAVPAPVTLAHLDLHSRDVFLHAYASKVGILKEQSKYYEAALDSTRDPGEQHAVLQELLGLNEEAQTLFGSLRESLKGCGGDDDVEKDNALGEEWSKYMEEFTEADLVRIQQLVPYLRARMNLVIQQIDILKQLSERQAELLALSQESNLSTEQSTNKLGSYSQAPKQQHSNGLSWQHQGFAPQPVAVDNISRGSTYHATLQQQRGPPPSFGNAVFDNPAAFCQQLSAIASSSPERFPALYDQRRQSFNGNSNLDRQRLQHNFKNDHPLHGQRSNTTVERGYGRGRSYDPPSHRRNGSYDTSMWQGPQYFAHMQMSPEHIFSLGNLNRQHDRRRSQDSTSSKSDRHCVYESSGAYQRGYREYERGHFASTSRGKGGSPGKTRGRQQSRSPSKQRDRSQTITPGARFALGSANDRAAAQHSHPFLPARIVDSASSSSSTIQHRGSTQSSTESFASIVTSDNLTKSSSKEGDYHGGLGCLTSFASAKDESSARITLTSKATVSNFDRASNSKAGLQQCSNSDSDGNIVKMLPSASEDSARDMPLFKAAAEDTPADNKLTAPHKIDQATESTQQPNVNVTKSLSDADTWQVARGAKKKPLGRPEPTEKTEPKHEKTRNKEPRPEHDKNKDAEALDRSVKGSKQSRATDKGDARDRSRGEPAKRPEGPKKGKGKSTDSSSSPKQEKSKEAGKSVDTSYRHDMSEASYPSLRSSVFFGHGTLKHNFESEATKATWSQMLKAQETRREAERILREATETILPDSPNWSLVSAPAPPKNNVGTPSSAHPGAFSYARAASGGWDSEDTLTPSQQAATPKSKPSDKLRATAPPFTPPAYYATLSSSSGNVGFPLLPSVAAGSLPEASTYAQKVAVGSQEGNVAVALTSKQIGKKPVAGFSVSMAIATGVPGAPTATSTSPSATILYSELAARYFDSPQTASGSKLYEAVTTKTFSASAPTSIAGSVPISGYAPSMNLPVSLTVMSYAQMAVTPITPKVKSQTDEPTTQLATPSKMPSNVSTPKSAKSDDSGATVRPSKSVSSLNAHARAFSYASAAATLPPPPSTPPPTPVAFPPEAKIQEAKVTPETPRPKSKSKKKGKGKQRLDQSFTKDTPGTSNSSQDRQERTSASGEKKQSDAKSYISPPSSNATLSTSLTTPNPGVSGPSTSASSEGSSMLASASAHSSYHKTDQTETDVGSLPFSSPVRRKDKYKHVPEWMPLDIGGEFRFKGLPSRLGGSWREISSGKSPHLGRAGLTSAADEDEVDHRQMGSEDGDQQYRQPQEERLDELAEANALEVSRQRREPKDGRECRSPQSAPSASATDEGDRDEKEAEGLSITHELKGFQSGQCNQTGAKGAEVTRDSADIGKELDDAKGSSDTRELGEAESNKNGSLRFNNVDIGNDGQFPVRRKGQSEGFPQKDPSTFAKQRSAERPTGQEPPKLENPDQSFSRGSLQHIRSGGRDEQCDLPGTHDGNLQHKRRYNSQPADSSVDQATKQGDGSGEDSPVGVAVKGGTHCGARSQGVRDVIDESEAKEAEEPVEGSPPAGQSSSSFNGGSSNHGSGGEARGDKWKQTREEVSQVEKQQGQEQKVQGRDQISGRSSHSRVVSLAGYKITLLGENVSTVAFGSHLAVEDASTEAHGSEQPLKISWSDELEDEWAGFEELRKGG